MRRILIAFLLALCSFASAEAGLVSLSTTWSDGQVLSHSALNNNFTDITGVLNGSVDNANLAATITFADGDFIDLAAINMSSATEGLKLGQAASCASATAEGQACWDTDDDDFYIGSGAAAIQVGTATVANVVTRTTADVTTTSATLADLTGATITMTTGANPVLLGFSGGCQHSNAAGDSINMNFQVDDTTLVLGTLGVTIQIAAINNNQPCSVTTMTADQTAASHQFDFQWSETGSGGTATMKCDSSSACTFWAVEVQD